jgi:acyl dehydratase
LVGAVIDENWLVVDAWKAGEFARAILDDPGLYSERLGARDEGEASVPAPLTFSVVVGHHRDQTAAMERLGLDITRVVQGETGWEYERPLVVGDRLQGRRVVTDVRHREGSRGGQLILITLETTYRDRQGERVLTQREVVIETERA